MTPQRLAGLKVESGHVSRDERVSVDLSESLFDPPNVLTNLGHPERREPDVCSRSNNGTPPHPADGLIAVCDLDDIELLANGIVLQIEAEQVSIYGRDPCVIANKVSIMRAFGIDKNPTVWIGQAVQVCLLYTSPSPRDRG